MQIEVKQNVQSLVFVFLKDSSANPKTGVAFGSVTCYISKAGAAPAAKTIDGSNWSELSAGNMPGWYTLTFAAGDLDTLGIFGFVINATGAVQYNDILSVVLATVGDFSLQVQRLLGLSHENSYMDNTAYNSFNKLTSARLRIYSSKANAQAHTNTGLIATYTITATYSGALLQSYQVVLEP